MYVRDLGVSLLRRWYLVILGLILTIGACFATVQLIPPSYQAQSSIVLLPPPRTVGDAGNPYLFLGSLNIAADILIRSMNAATARQRIEDEFPAVSFEAERDGTTSAPIMIIIAIGDTPQETVQALNVLVDSVGSALAGLQDPLAVPADARISSMRLAADDVPTKDSKSRTRALVAVAAVCLTLAVLLTGFVDRVLTSRRARRLSRIAGGAEDEYLPTPGTMRSPTGEAPPDVTRTEEPQTPDDWPTNQRRGSAQDDDAALNADRGRHRPTARTRS